MGHKDCQQACGQYHIIIQKMKTKMCVVGDNISCKYVASDILVIMQVLGCDCEGE